MAKLSHFTPHRLQNYVVAYVGYMDNVILQIKGSIFVLCWIRFLI